MKSETSDFKWGVLVAACTRRLRSDLSQTDSFEDCEVIPHFDGRPDDMFVWFICGTRSEKERFRERLIHVTDQLRATMIAEGFPRDAAATLTSDVTSSEEIEAGGGRFHFFR